MEKMYKDIPELLYEEQQLAHFVDETLAFDQEIKNNYALPDNQLGCLHVLCLDQAFTHWLEIEKKCKQYRYNHTSL